MNQNRRAARAIAIARADESRTHKFIVLKLTAIAVFAVCALAVLPSLLSV